MIAWLAYELRAGLYRAVFSEISRSRLLAFIWQYVEFSFPGTDLDINFNFYLEYLAIFGYFNSVHIDLFDQKFNELRAELDALRPATPKIQQAMQSIVNILVTAAYPEKKPGRIRREKYIIETLKKSGTSPIQEILKGLPWIKRPTLKSDLARMIRTKKIRKEGVKKGTIYFL